MIFILGGGLSGLVTAMRLQQAEIPCKVIEARERLGGRIHTVRTNHGARLEMGATWFGNKHRNLVALLKELKMERFQQYNGNHYFFYEPQSVNHGKYAMPSQEPSYRISGGSATLIEQLSTFISSEDLLLGKEARKVDTSTGKVQITLSDGQVLEGDRLVVTIPPRIWAETITFSPSLPSELLQVAKSTQTWMEDSTKVAVEYKNPFWRNDHQLGTLVSNTGPFIECYDHTDANEKTYALCGFVNPSFNALSEAEREKAVIYQLTEIFGDVAATPLNFRESIWGEDPYTKWQEGGYLMPHENNGHPIFRKDYFEGKILFSGTETAAEFPGYMDGAVWSGEEAAKRVIAQI